MLKKKTLASNPEEEYKLFLSHLNHKHKLHEGQIPPARALFTDGKKKVFVQAGRKFGKSYLDRYVTYRLAGSIPETPVYLILPVLKQAYEIYWASNLMQNYIHPQFIKKIFNRDYRVVLWNDSFIKLDGSDNPELHRGPEVGGLVMDEMKDFDPDFWPAMRPNLLVRQAAFMASGSPPINDFRPSEKFYLDLARECREDTDGFYGRYPCWCNPRVPKKDLEKIRDRLIANGEEDVWLREYEGLFIKGGKSLIFPMLNRTKHVPEEEQMLLEMSHHDHSQYEWHCIADPATAKPFGMLFIAYHRPTARIWVMRELYVKEQDQNSTRPMYVRESAIIDSLYPWPTEWFYTYDEAEAWFCNERSNMGANYGWQPTYKQGPKAEIGEAKPGASVIKDALRNDLIKIHPSCVNLINEMESYSKNSAGLIPKGNDHLIDCLRYFVQRVQYTVIEDKVVVPHGARVVTPHQEVDVERGFDEQFNMEIEPWMY